MHRKPQVGDMVQINVCGSLYAVARITLLSNTEALFGALRSPANQCKPLTIPVSELIYKNGRWMNDRTTGFYTDAEASDDCDMADAPPAPTPPPTLHTTDPAPEGSTVLHRTPGGKQDTGPVRRFRRTR